MKITSSELKEKTAPVAPSGQPKFIFSYNLSGSWYVFDRSYNKKLNNALPRSKFTIGDGK